MFGLKARSPGVIALTLGLILLFAPGSEAENRPQPPDAIRIGMISTLFRDTPESVVLAMMQPFGALMESQTGVLGQLVPGGCCQTLGQSLANDKVQLGVFHGIEFAWARQKFPQLKPLCIAVNQYRQLHAYLVVREDSKTVNFADLKGTPFAIPKQTREHCHVYVQQRCQRIGLEPGKFFKEVLLPASVEEALDDVVDRVVEATIVDGVGLDCYKRRKPGRFTKLKVLHQSEAFPAAVVAYRPGVVGEATLDKFRTGMLKANQSALGRQMLNLWKLTGFEPVPAEYEQNLTAIVKAYPPVRASK